MTDTPPPSDEWARLVAEFETKPGYEKDQVLIENAIDTLHKNASALLKYKAFPAVEIDDALRNCGGLVRVFDGTAETLTFTAGFIRFLGERLKATEMLDSWDSTANKLSAPLQPGIRRTRLRWPPHEQN